MRLHRTTLVALIIGVVVCLGVFTATSRARDDNESRLLALRAVEVGNLFDSLAGNYETDLTSVAAIARATDGDATQFAAAVESVRSEIPTASWVLLRSGVNGIEVVAQVVGDHPATLPADLQADPHLARAFDGQFAVTDLLGEGFARSIAMAAGAPGSGGAYAVYTEVPLLAAATSTTETDAAAADAEDPLGDLQAAFYIGSGDEASLLFALGTPTGDVARVERTIGAQTITVLVSASAPLSGGFADALPDLLVVLGLVMTVGVGVVVEHNLRRRDGAVTLAGELIEKNGALDQALAERDEADRERGRLESELRQSQRLDAIGQLAGGIAHDFNNLLAAILSYADLIAGDLEGHPSAPDVEEIRRAARRGSALTRKLLLFSQDAPTRVEVLELNALVTELERLLGRAIGEEVELITELGADVPPILGDASGLEQVLMNLVLNARDAIDGDGRVVVSTDTIELGAGDHATLPAGRYVRLRVSDNGHGMDEETTARAFEPFFTTKARGRGTGLGLSTAYGIVQQAGGHIAVASAPGAGTTFTVLLPVNDAPADAGATGEGPAAAASLHRGTVLLVEDEDPVRRAARRMLERRGFTVLEARDGVEAVGEFVDLDIDVLLTDVILPGGLSGADVADRMREAKPDIAVIYMSGYSADILARRGIGSESAPRLLSKPFSETDLIAAVVSAAQESSSR